MRHLLVKLVCILTIFSPSVFASIHNYQETFIPLFSKEGHLKIAIRHFQKDNEFLFLVVDPFSYSTEIISPKEFNSRNTNESSHSRYYQWEIIKKTPYIKSLFKYTEPSAPLENAGLIHAERPVNGLFLTVDMCPSSKKFEEKFFHKLVTISEKTKHPFPVAISVSGLWILQHKNEFEWLLEMSRNNKLGITWVNHSFSHLYFSDLSYDKNFLLFRFSNIKDEIFSNEILLLQEGQVPSVFFRMPGLVSDDKVLEQLRQYGLIPLGADAWLAKEEKPHKGSIILVHGNSNEHLGIIDLMPYLEDPKIRWLPIIDALNPTKFAKTPSSSCEESN